MSVSVAEYLGQRTDVNEPGIRPASENALCPFMNKKCKKVPRYEPVCSVRKTHGELWIVCENRLCSSRRGRLSVYQKDILMQIGRNVFDTQILPDNIAIKREVQIPVSAGSKYKADYIMVLHNYRLNTPGPTRVVLEMQGGGETSGTGALTIHINAWRTNSNRDNAQLAKPISTVGTIETNAWRRQQEQFIIKGSIATRTGGGMILCVGKPLFDYLLPRLNRNSFRDLRQHSWSLAIIAFREKHEGVAKQGPIPLEIDPERLIFTDYMTFVQALINQGEPYPGLFHGEFELLSGSSIAI